jgi:peptidoglycan/xylan/chitin deacetylase (PgdA/CDA1 family)
MLYRILELLKTHNFRGIFFLTGHMAEKISKFPKILDLLESQEIGYHSSAHTVRPTIIELTDVENYELARHYSLTRETRHINPLTGKAEGQGGIISLQNLFSSKKIVSFRAPGYSYSPPHLEALNELGITYDFSTNLSEEPLHFKNTTFYPFPDLIDSPNAKAGARIARSLLKGNVSVLAFHPNYFVNADHWDSLYYPGNPQRFLVVPARSHMETKSLLRRFDMFLSFLNHLEKTGLLKVDPKLEMGKKQEKLSSYCVSRSYQLSVGWSTKFFGYKPRFVLSHYKHFFEKNETQVK